MIRRFGPVTLIFLLLGLVPAAAHGQAAQSKVIPDQFIVVLEPRANPHAEAAAAERAHGLQRLHVYEHALKGFAFKGSAQAAQALARSPNVKFVSQDREVQAVAQTLPTGINRVDADLNTTSNINGSDQRVNVDVAIIDTGIDPSHPDLNVVGGVNCSEGTSFNDGNGHGTHVAGTVGALDNGAGVVGVAPGVRLWAVRVLNNAGSGTWSGVICGVDWVTQNSATIKVANMSLGGGGSDDGNCGNSNADALHQAICNSVNNGVVYAVAAGNDNINSSGFVPAAYDEVLTVSAIADYNGQPGGGAAATCGNYGSDDRLASFSNFGSDVDIAAPGVCIYSTNKGGSYSTLSGTSMASPHVAGVAALYVANNDGASTAAGAATIRNNIKDPSKGYSVAQGSANGFSGDKDTSAEPLAFVGPAAPTTAPATPSNLTATAASSSQINLAWTDNSNDEDGFKIERSPDGASGWTQVATVAANATSYQNTGLTASTTYHYRVRANNAAGDSGYSNTANATTSAAAAVPAAPSGLTASAVSSSQINLAWTDNSANETGFRIERSTNGSTFSQIASVGANATSYSSTGLSSSTTYYYRVRAYNSTGNSAYSNTANATTTGKPAKPSGLSARAVSSTRIDLAWTDNSSNETGFKIQRSTDGSNWTQIATVGANVTTYSSTGLTSKRLYHYRVRAYNGSGNSSYSNTATATTL